MKSNYNFKLAYQISERYNANVGVVLSQINKEEDLIMAREIVRGYVVNPFNHSYFLLASGRVVEHYKGLESELEKVVRGGF